MAQKKPKKMKWWKNSSLLFTGAVLLIPLAIFAATVGMVVKKSAAARPSTNASQSPVAFDDFQFALDVSDYISQGETIAKYGLSHTRNLTLNSAAGRLQHNLLAPKATLAKWLKAFKLQGVSPIPGGLTLPNHVVAQLNATSDRQMAGVMNDFASQLSKAKGYALGSPKLVAIRKQLEFAAGALSHDVHAVIVGN